MVTKHLGDFYNKTNYWQGDRWADLVELLDKTPLDKGGVGSVLDVGSGSGKQTKKLLDVFGHAETVVGCDISTAMLETARREHSDSRISYLEMNAEKVGGLAGKYDFDVVHAHFALHWVENKEAFFEGLNKVTHEGSYFMLGTCQDLPNILWDIDAFMRAAFAVPASTPAPFHYLDLGEWCEILKRYGWKVEAASVRYDNHYTGDVLEYIDHWVSTSTQKICYGHWYEDLEPAVKARMMEGLLAKYQHEEENSFLFPEETLLLVAKRIA